MLKTKFEEIVDVKKIGSAENSVNLNELLVAAGKERLNPSKKDKESVLLLIIDMQQDFMENGALAVPNSHKDVENLVQWIYKNIEQVTKIAVSLDTHTTRQIFHPYWWADDDLKNHPDPYTEITKEDLDNGNWKPIVNPTESIDYVENLESQGKKKLMVWTYHCLLGTQGHALENQLSNIVYFHSVARRTPVIHMVKGGYPMSEMYGILKAEYDPKNRVNLDFLNKVAEYDKVLIAGEAKSHCVLETIRQILEHYRNDLAVTQKIYILEDCMSSIPGFEDATEEEFERFKQDFKVNIVKSTEIDLEASA